MPATSSETIEILVNGDRKNVPGGLTVAALLSFLGIDRERVAVELNRSIVRREQWTQAAVGPGAELEIVQFVGGG
jgi:thiamine biosynthesis protein ThiS